MHSRRVIAAISVTVVLWGSAFVAIRATLPSLAFESLVSSRLLLGATAFAVLARPLGVRRPQLRQLPLLLAIGASGLFGYQMLLSAGETTLPAGTSAMLFAAAPVLASVLAGPVLGERLDRRRWGGVAVALVGVFVVSSTQGLAAGGSLTGALLVLAAVGCYAPWVILTKLAARTMGSFDVAAWSSWLAALMVLPFSGGVPGALAHAGAGTVAGVLYLGLVVTTIPLVLWSWVLRSVPASIASSSLLLIGPSALLCSWAVLGEAPALAALGGGAITLAGVATAQLPRAPRLTLLRRHVAAPAH